MKTPTNKSYIAALAILALVSVTIMSTRSAHRGSTPTTVDSLMIEDTRATVNPIDGATNQYKYNSDGSFSLNIVDRTGLSQSDYNLSFGADNSTNYQWTTPDGRGAFSTINGVSTQVDYDNLGNSNVRVDNAADGSYSTTTHDATTTTYFVHTVDAKGLASDATILVGS